jgi:hypothetical protein
MKQRDIDMAIAEVCDMVRPYYMDGVRCTNPPSYTTDLNAMHDAEEWMKTQPHNEYSQSSIFAYETRLLVNFGPRATAYQRAKTFLETINLWKD